MIVVVLDAPSNELSATSWRELPTTVRLDLYDATPFAEILNRIEHATVIVSRSVPLRREVLDYATRPRLLVVPSSRRDDLVESPIAAQLGIDVREFDEPGPGAPSGAWAAAVVEVVSAAI